MVADSRASARGAQPLVIAERIDRELAEQRAIFGDDAHVAAGHQQGHALVFVGAAQGDVT